MFGSSFTTLIISNEEMNDIKIVASLEKSRLIIKGVSETINNEVKQQKGGFLGMVLAIHSAVHNQIFRSSSTTLIVSNEELNIIKVHKSLDKSGLLIKGASERITNEAKELKGGFLRML